MENSNENKSIITVANLYYSDLIMKKILLVAILSFTISHSFAQWTTSGTNIYTSNTGNVGIGTASPAVKLSVTPSTTASLRSAFTTTTPMVNIAPIGGNGVVIIEGSNSSIAAGILALRSNRSVNFAYNNSSSVNDLLGAVAFEGFSTTTGISRLGSYIYSDVESVQSTSLSSNLKFGTTDATGTQAIRLYVSSGGLVGINTLDTKGYQFAVNGSAIATSMTIKLNTNWPDYVFKPSYQLPTLSEVKSYIDQNQHLPEMPSEQEIAKNGLNLGEINTLLTKKVEELTLYLIEQEKAQSQQQQKITSQEDRISKLEKTIEQLLKNK
jgi:hypothetical protein